MPIAFGGVIGSGQKGQKSLIWSLVGVRGFEPPTSTSRTWRATKLRYTPIVIIIGGFNLLGNDEVLYCDN